MKEFDVSCQECYKRGFPQEINIAVNNLIFEIPEQDPLFYNQVSL